MGKVVERDIDFARADYSKHTKIRKKGDDALVISRDGSSAFWAEIIAGERGGLVITGDGPDIILRTWSDMSLEGLLKWCATSGLDYLATKVMCGKGVVYEEAAAMEDLEAEIKMYREEIEKDPDGGCEYDHLYLNALNGLRDKWSCDIPASLEDLHSDLEDAFPAGNTWEWKWGRRPSMDLIRAREICRRACVLLRLLDDLN